MHSELPQQAGTCLKAEHYQAAMNDRSPAGWFEVHAENYMGDGGPNHWWLDRIRREFPLSIHGVGLSIGSAGDLDAVHLKRLAAVAHRFEPAMISEHLAWSSHGGNFYNDLLPLPYTQSTLDRVCDHIDQVQQCLGRQILLENPSTYIAFEQSTMSETDFLTAVSHRSGCGLLLDINNVYVSANNQGYDAEDYIDQFPLAQVGEIHLAGHAEEPDADGQSVLIDTHDREVAAAVWQLYEYTLRRIGPLPTLIEWDADIPSWDMLGQQASQANTILRGVDTSRGQAVVG